MNIDKIQKDLTLLGVDGWLIFDFRRSNDLGCELLEIPHDRMLTRRFFFWIPAKGVPLKIVHSVEPTVLEHLLGQQVEYRTWQELEERVAEALKGAKTVAMEYSPRCQIPYLSKVDAGTIEVIRGLGVKVVSSADLMLNTLTKEQIAGHLFAAQVVDEVVELSWQLIAGRLGAISEYDVQQFILQEFAKRGCVSDDSPLCAVNQNGANPHYCPSQALSAPINPGDFILIDLSCKKKGPGSIYADITRVGAAAREATAKQQEVFEVVKRAQEAGLQLVETRFARGEPLFGWEVDKACRDVIEKAGWGQYFTHRTGHNLGQHIHGNGTHMDNFETKEMRRVVKQTCFTIEPGIYLPGEFGIRLEYDVLITDEGKVVVTGGRQSSIKLLALNN